MTQVQTVFDFSVLGLGEVVGTLGRIPPCLAAMLAELNFEMADRQRRAVLKYLEFPDKLGGQRLLASSIHRYGRKRPDVTEIEDAQGEVFFAGGFYEDHPELVKALEQGGEVNADKPFVVPIGEGAKRVANGIVPTAEFKRGLRDRVFSIINRGGLPPLLVKHVRGRHARLELMGIFVRRRHQRAMLGWEKRWDETEAKFRDQYERLIDMALTESGRQALADRAADREGRSAAYNAAYSRELMNWANYGRGNRKAREAAKIAGRAAEREFRIGGNS